MNHRDEPKHLLKVVVMAYVMLHSGEAQATTETRQEENI